MKGMGVKCCRAGTSPDEGGSGVQYLCGPGGSLTFAAPLGGKVE